MDDYCDACGATGPLYQDREAEHLAYCESCSTIQHGEGLGERYAAARMFMQAAQSAHHLGVKGADLHHLLAEALEQYDGDAGHVDVPPFPSMGETPRADRGWLARPEVGGVTAKVFELHTEGQNRDDTSWHEIDTIERCRSRRPESLLNLWIAENEPEPGTFRIETSEGGWAETAYAKRALA